MYVHCNHIVCAANKPLEVTLGASSSVPRHERMEAVANDALGEITVHGFQGFLADHEGGEDAICRHGESGIRSNGSVIMEPATRSLWMCFGPACTGEWKKFVVG